ncbi:MAG: hypothetical protein F6K35_11485 [Okeania sp. SIO2H7]|nr:hypothetical protein [Okeania sp. SIO2H7]
MTNNSLIYLRVWMDKFGLDPDYWLENSPHLPIPLLGGVRGGSPSPSLFFTSDETALHSYEGGRF